MKTSVLLLTLTCIAGLWSTCTIQAAEHLLSSPDKRIRIQVADTQGSPSYKVWYDGKPFILDSPLGVVTNLGDFTKSMSITDVSEVKAIADTYSLPNIKQSHVDYKANEQAFSFAQGGKKIYDIIFRVSNSDVAFRYRLYPQGDTRCCIINREATSFTLPEGTTTFLCPQSKPMGGFARTSPSYETPYTADEPTGKKGWGEGYTFPCLFKNNADGWVLISETGTDGSYCGCRLIGHEKGRYSIGFPQEMEMNGLGPVAPGISLPGETPWRTITLGETLAPIVETTVAFDLVTPKYEASKQYEYGKGTWSWIIGMDGSTNYEEQRRYIDFAAAMGYQSVLVDALWDTQIGYSRIEELAAYGATKGVGLYLWYNSNGYWNDAPQGPRGIMDKSITRRKEMAWMRRTGIKGIKVDFFGGDKQPMLQLYEDILSDANDFGLMVIFHGCTLPRGWERMYPNFVASEAVLASENLHFSQGSCDAEAFNACLHPFIRNTVGSMDFGGSALNHYYNAKNSPGGSRRVTSDVFALATAVLFQCAVQHFALAPNNLQDAPAWAIDFMKEVPTTWDEVRFIDGYPGKYVVLARRKGINWYIAGVNAQKESISLELKLPMLEAGTEVELYTDNKNLEGSVEKMRINKKQILKVKIPTNGGLVIHTDKPEAVAASGRNPWNNPVTSPVVSADGQVTFSIDAPHAKEVLLSGQFMEGTRPLTKDKEGIWRITVHIDTPDIYPYSFIVDGVNTQDPSNPLIFPNERFKASLLEMPKADALYTVNDVPHGKMEYSTYYSKVLGMNRPLVVYTPAGYEEGNKRYPVLYLVSGTTDTEETWFKVGRANSILDNLIAQGKAEPMIAVMPYGYMMNGTPMPSSMQAAEMYSTFAKEMTECIIPFVESNYRTRDDKDSRAIAGFSRGGGQSLFTAFSHPETFGWVGSYSAYLTPQVMDKYFGDQIGRKLLNEQFKLLWFGVGNSDFLYADVVKHLEYFDSKGIGYRKKITQGGHTWMNARDYLAKTVQLFFKSNH